MNFYKNTYLKKCLTNPNLIISLKNLEKMTMSHFYINLLEKTVIIAKL